MSETKTIVRSKVATSRKFDHVYDPTYSISDAKDLRKATAKAVYSSSNFVRTWRLRQLCWTSWQSRYCLAFPKLIVPRLALV